MGLLYGILCKWALFLFFSLLLISLSYFYFFYFLFLDLQNDLIFSLMFSTIFHVREYFFLLGFVGCFRRNGFAADRGDEKREEASVFKTSIQPL